MNTENTAKYFLKLTKRNFSLLTKKIVLDKQYRFPVIKIYSPHCTQRSIIHISTPQAVVQFYQKLQSWARLYEDISLLSFFDECF